VSATVSAAGSMAGEACATGTTSAAGSTSGSVSGAAAPTSENALPVTATAAAPRRSGVGITDLSTPAPTRRRWRGATTSGSWCAPRPRGERCRATTCLPDRRPGKDVRLGGAGGWGVPCPFRDLAVIDPRGNVSNLQHRCTSAPRQMGRERAHERRAAVPVPRSGERSQVAGEPAHHARTPTAAAVPAPRSVGERTLGVSRPCRARGSRGAAGECPRGPTGGAHGEGPHGRTPSPSTHSISARAPHRWGREPRRSA
jgi:hypothetical protein